MTLGDILAAYKAPKEAAKLAAKSPEKPSTAQNLNRAGLATHEEGLKGKTPWQLAHDPKAAEKLVRVMSQAEWFFRDLRKGLRDKSNGVNVVQFNTNTAPATNTGAGIMFHAAQMNGGIPWNAFTIKDVGGAGTTMDVSINDSDWIPSVAAGGREENMEIWKIAFRVRTGGAGTATIILYKYTPGIGGLDGIK